MIHGLYNACSKVLRCCSQQLRSVVSKSGINADVQVIEVEKKPRCRTRDREKRTAFNVIAIIEFLNEKGFLGEQHIRSSNLLNPLREPNLII